jgi:fumarate reductase flavoprotein subunit
VGVIAKDKEGQPIEVQAKAVIIASGGYANNADMMERYVQNGKYAVPAIPLLQVGGPIQMAWDAGAAPDGLGVIMAICGITGEKIDSQLLAAAAQPALWVNRNGDRFCDESIFYNFPFAANALVNQPGGVAYSIFDENLKQLYIQKGIDTALGQYVPVDTRLDKLDQRIADGIKAGKAFVGDTIADLAKQIDIAPDVLQTTIDEYNRYCNAGYDALFVKDRRLLHEVKTSRFYAIKLTVQTLATLGGLKSTKMPRWLEKMGRSFPAYLQPAIAPGGCTATVMNLRLPAAPWGLP